MGAPCALLLACFFSVHPAIVVLLLPVEVRYLLCLTVLLAIICLVLHVLVMLVLIAPTSTVAPVVLPMIFCSAFCWKQLYIAAGVVFSARFLSAYFAVAATSIQAPFAFSNCIVHGEARNSMLERSIDRVQKGRSPRFGVLSVVPNFIVRELNRLRIFKIDLTIARGQCLLELGR